MTRRIVVAAVLVLAAMPALAHNPPFVVRPAASSLAVQYEQEAAMWRAEAARHRQMAADYRVYSKTQVNPAIAKMEQHCLSIVDEANARAADAEARAKAYRLGE